MSDLIPLREAADNLGLTINLLMSWCDQYIPGYAGRDPFGRRRLTEGQLEVIRLVSVLKTQRLPETEIAKRLKPLIERLATQDRPAPGAGAWRAMASGA